jgi:hypothetical protein
VPGAGRTEPIGGWVYEYDESSDTELLERVDEALDEVERTV